MRRDTIPRVVVVAASSVLMATSAAGLIQRSPDRAPSGAAGGVDIADFAYGPDVVQVAVGDTVTWTNSDDFAHTVTSDAGGGLDSGEIAADGTFEGTFREPGTVEYVCTIHPSMTGVVEVTR